MAMQVLKVLTIAVAGALTALMLYAGEPAELWWWLLAAPFGIWIIGPSLMPYVLARWIKRRRFVYVMLAFLALSSAWSAAVYYQAFVWVSSTAALVMIFAPLYQWIALACVGLLSIGVVKWLDRSGT